MRLWIALFSFFLCENASATMLSQAEAIGQLYSQDIAKKPPPAPFPLALPALTLSSVWFTPPSDPEFLTQNETWKMLKNIGFDGIHIERSRQEGQITLQAKWKKNWPEIGKHAQEQGMVLLGDLIGKATTQDKDFQEAIQNVADYPSLYHLVEIDPVDWPLLPSIPAGSSEANIPWLSLQTLHKKGYVPNNFTPYVKESDWNATDKIIGKDGKIRRWIYLKEGKNNPLLSWLSPSFAAYRLSSGDALYLYKELGMQILHLEQGMPQDMLALWIRKLGGYSAAKTNGTLDSLRNQSADLLYDTVTQPALLHALIAQDAEALRMIYQLLLLSKIETKQLVHTLQSFDPYVCDWVELIHAPKKKFRYYEEQMTGEVLKGRLLKEDLYKLQSKDPIAPATWVDHCARALHIKDFEKHEKEIANAHLLFAFTYAMQPGAFSVSFDDLVGMIQGKSLYGDISSQLKNRKSFASRLKSILQARMESNIAGGELIEVMSSPNPGSLLLLYRLPNTRFLYLLALNFSKQEVVESIERSEFSQKSAIDLLSQLTEEKIFSSSALSFILPPLSGKAIYFQPKYYD